MCWASLGACSREADRSPEGLVVDAPQGGTALPAVMGLVVDAPQGVTALPAVVGLVVDTPQGGTAPPAVVGLVRQPYRWVC